MPNLARAGPAPGMAAAKRIAGLSHEIVGALHATADIHSRLRLVADIMLFRVLRIWPGLEDITGNRAIRAAGAHLTYRLNRGDIQGIREVWIDRIYRMPPPHRFPVVVDLGTNIGLTAVWLHREYGAELIIGIEPDRENVDLARQNFKANSLRGRVVHAAIGPSDGSARFAAAHGSSNLGQVSASGELVRQISMNTVLAQLSPGQRVDLLKLDIEGGEQNLLLAEDVGWLDRVDAIIAEFHPDRVDVHRLVVTLERRGFTFLPAGSLWQGSMDIFRRSAGP